MRSETAPFASCDGLTSSALRSHRGHDLAACHPVESADLLVAYQGIERDRADPMPSGGIPHHNKLPDFRGKPSVGAGL
jgi:hypothetical protein